MFRKLALAAMAAGFITGFASAQIQKAPEKGTKPPQPVQQIGDANMELNLPEPAIRDADGDGQLSYAHGGADCDDNDARRYAGNVEVGDPESRDEDCNPETFGTVDSDGDGFYSNRACNRRPDGSMNCGRDCDDSNPRIHPLQIDVLNGRDDNCNLEVDEDQTAAEVLRLLQQ